MQIKYAVGKTSEHVKVMVNYTIKLHFDWTVFTRRVYFINIRLSPVFIHLDVFLYRDIEIIHYNNGWQKQWFHELSFIIILLFQLLWKPNYKLFNGKLCCNNLPHIIMYNNFNVCLMSYFPPLAITIFSSFCFVLFLMWRKYTLVVQYTENFFK